MVHLLRSLIAGYFVAFLAGFIATLAGAGAFSVIMGIWLGGSMLSVVLAACFAKYAYTPEELHATPPRSREPVRPMRRDLTAKEIALWDDDMAADRYEADLAADRAEQADKAHKNPKTG